MNLESFQIRVFRDIPGATEGYKNNLLSRKEVLFTSQDYIIQNQKLYYLKTNEVLPIKKSRMRKRASLNITESSYLIISCFLY